MPDLLKPAEAAKFLGVCEKILVRHVDAGDLPAIDVGRGAKKRRLRYDPADLEAFKEKRKTSGKACQSGKAKTAFTRSILKSNVVDLRAALALVRGEKPRLSSVPHATRRARKSEN